MPFNPMTSGWLGAQAASKPLSPEEQLDLSLRQTQNAVQNNQPPVQPSDAQPVRIFDKIAAPMGASPTPPTAAATLSGVTLNPFTGLPMPSQDMNRSQSVSRKITPMSPGEMASLQAQAEQSDGIKSQQNGLDDLKALLMQRLQNHAQVDLSPLLAYADSLNAGKSHLAASYKAPETQDQNAKELMGYGDEMQKRKKDLSDEINRYIATAKNGGTTTDTQTDSVTTGSLKGPNGNGSSKNGYDQAWKNLYPMVKGPLDEMHNLDQSKALLDSDVPAAMGAVKMKIAKGLAGQRLSQQEFSAVSGDPRFGSRIAQGINSAFGSGSFTPQNKDEYNAMIDAVKEVASKRVQSLADQHALDAPTVYGLPADSMRQTFYHRLGFPMAGSPAQAPAAQSPAAPPSTQQGSGPLSPAEWLRVHGSK